MNTASMLDLRDQPQGEEAPRAEARGFEADELRPLTVPQLRSLVRSQLDNIKEPLPVVLKLSKANKPALIQLLTNPAYGFKTRDPKLVFTRGIGVQQQKNNSRKRRDSKITDIPSPSPVRVPTVFPQHVGNASGHTLTVPSPVPPVAPAQAPCLDQGSAPSLPGEGEPMIAQQLDGLNNESAFGGFVFDNLYAFDIPPEQITLTLYIMDERSPAPLPDLVKVTVNVVRNLAGRAVANWNDILREVQKTASAIRGSNLKLSYSRSDKDGFKVAILQVLALPIDKASVSNAELLIDESFPVYRLHVEPLGTTSPIPRRARTPDVQAALEAIERYSSSHPGMRSMPQLRRRGKSRTLVEGDAVARDKEWLQEQVSKRDGYEVMAKKHDTKMSYARVAQQWAFAVSCLDEFTKRRFPHSNGQIYSYHVWDALSRKGTWCLAAKEGHRLYQEHVDHPDVAEAVSDTSRKGHLGFLALLRQVEG